jgi:hypothetical protein
VVTGAALLVLVVLTICGLVGRRRRRLAAVRDMPAPPDPGGTQWRDVTSPETRRPRPY